MTEKGKQSMDEEEKPEWSDAKLQASERPAGREESNQPGAETPQNPGQPGQPSDKADPGAHTGGTPVRTLLRSLSVAFSIYSKIPMPRFVWGSSDMEYHLIFFPAVGAVIGLLEIALAACFCHFAGPGADSAGNQAAALTATALPLIVTGGFHMDGYLDTMDAIHSYGNREKKLAVMDDPHIGGFAVIWAMVWALLTTAGYLGVLGNPKALYCTALGFPLSRAFSGLGVVTIPSAKKKGMLATFSGTAAKRTVTGTLAVEIAMIGLVLILLSPVIGTAVFAACGLTFLAYRSWSLRAFGGITGDLAGWFVTVSELVLLLTAAVCSRLL